MFIPIKQSLGNLSSNTLSSTASMLSSFPSGEKVADKSVSLPVAQPEAALPSLIHSVPAEKEIAGLSLSFNKQPG